MSCRASPNRVLSLHQDLEAIVFGRVVAAGHHHAGSGLKKMRGVIQHGGRHLTDVDHGAPAGLQPGAQCLGQRRAGSAPVPRDHHRWRFRIQGTQRLSDLLDAVRVRSTSTRPRMS